MKIDTHTHTSGVSFCSEVNTLQYVKAYQKAGYPAVVLTNHYSRQYMFRYADKWEKQIRIFLGEYHEAAKYGKHCGVNVLLGAEVAIATPQSPYIEFLLYGATEEFFLANPRLYDCSQAKLYKICHDSGVLMYQSHPFRREQGHCPQDPEFMDGTEINCHPMFLRHEDSVREFAAKYSLGLVCGSDFHYLRQAGSAATYFDENVKSTKDLARCLRENKRPDIFYR